MRTLSLAQLHKALRISLLLAVLFFALVTFPSLIFGATRDDDTNSKEINENRKSSQVEDQTTNQDNQNRGDDEDEDDDERRSPAIPSQNQNNANQGNTTTSTPPTIPGLLYYFFGQPTSESDTSETPQAQEPEEETILEIPPPTPKTLTPQPRAVPQVKPQVKKPQATSTAGIITSDTTPDETLPEVQEAELAKSSQINPLLNFWKKDSSGYDMYMYAGLGATTTLFLLLFALMLGASGFSLIVHDSLTQFGTDMTSRAFAQRTRSFKRTLVSNN